MDNVISEFKVIETDDGFRIEIKGDKEKIRSFIGNFEHSKSRHWRHGPGPGFGWGPWGFHPMMWANMAHCWEPEEEETEKKNEA
jgi:hypothetical protein